MPTHDIIDNRHEKLVDHINRMLDSTEFARFAVGYFFLSGLESIAGRLDSVKELRLLIGSTTNRKTLVRMIEEKRLKVRVYTKGRMHAKAYIFDYYGSLFDRVGKPVERHEKGIAVVGSSNLTLSGVSHNTELNVVVQGNDNHATLAAWFDELWNESQDFDETLMHEMQQSWAIAPVRPYDIYMKTLYMLVKDRLEGEDA